MDVSKQLNSIHNSYNLWESKKGITKLSPKHFTQPSLGERNQGKMQRALS